MCDGRSCLSDFKFHIIWNLLIVWAISSAGRALRSQRRGREFEPLIVHQYKTLDIPTISRVFACLFFVIICNKNAQNGAIWCYLVLFGVTLSVTLFDLRLVFTQKDPLWYLSHYFTVFFKNGVKIIKSLLLSNVIR